MMKKIISLALTLAMLCSLAVTASAVTIVGKDGGVDPEQFAVEDNSYVVDIKVVTGDLLHRYAVDLDFQNVLLSIDGGSMYWDVDDLVYKPVDEEQDGDLDDSYYDITVTNRSDLPIEVSVDLVDNYSAADDDLGEDDGIEFEIVDENHNPLDLSAGVEVDSAAPAEGQIEGSPEELPFALYVHAPNGWDEVLKHYGPLLASGASKTIGTCTINIDKVNG